MYEMVAGVEKDSQGNISFPSVLRVVDSHIRVRVDEEDSFHAAWVALGGAKRRRRNYSAKQVRTKAMTRPIPTSALP